jgi:hypothetical protein
MCDCVGHDPGFSRWTGFWPGELEAIGLGLIDENGERHLDEIETEEFNKRFLIKPIGCDECGIAMVAGNDGCKKLFALDGAGNKVRRISHKGELYCPECKVKPGGTHHLGCVIENCPMCGKQFLSCECDWVDTVEN